MSVENIKRRKVLVIGGVKFLGRQLVEELIKKEYQVYVLSLDRPTNNKVEWISINRHNIEGLKEFFHKKFFDFVFDNIAFNGAEVHDFLENFGFCIGKYVLTSTVDIYENQERLFCKENVQGVGLSEEISDLKSKQQNYAAGKRSAEKALFKHTNVRYSVARVAIVVGREDNVGSGYGRSLFYPHRIRDSLPILLRDTDRKIYQLVYVEDAAKALVLLAESDQSDGQIFNVCSDEVFTTEKMISSLAGSAGLIKPNIIRVPDHVLDDLGVDSPYRLSRAHEWPLFDNQKMKSLGWAPTSIKEWGKLLFADSSKFENKSAISQRTKEVQYLASLHRGMFVRNQKFTGVLSTIGIGTYLGEEDWPNDEKYLLALRKALNSGINLVDTAVSYRNGRSEVVTKVAIQGYDRSKIFIVSKGGYVNSGLLSILHPKSRIVQDHHSIIADYLELSLKQSIRNLGTYVDLYLIHNPERAKKDGLHKDFYGELTKSFAMLEQKVSDGFINGYGIATWSGLIAETHQPNYISLAEVIRCAEIAAGGKSNFTGIEFPLNLSLPQAATFKNQSGQTLLDFAKDRGLLTLTSASADRNAYHKSYDLLGNGLSNAQKSLLLCSSYSKVDCSIVGMRSVDHVDDANAVIPFLTDKQVEEYLTRRIGNK
jgi:nucleoside-diphosphate-sugar epimerase